MSLITSCPACGTMFRVVPDQLKISEGWVRCGHCGEVFDASAHLSDEAAIAGAQEPTRPADIGPVPAKQGDGPGEEALPRPEQAPAGPLPLMREEAAPPAEPATMPAELATRPADLPSAPSELRPRPTAAPPASVFGPDSQSLEPSPLDSPFVFRRSDLAEALDSSIQPPAPRESQFLVEELEEPTPAELNDVSFVRQARRKAFWRRPLVRVALVFASLVLAALLLLQLAWQDRDRLALAEPALRPALQHMCEWLHCTLGPPRQIESIAIESSGFNRLRNDTYRLAFTLRNTARVPVAVPAMELTITDAQDQPIARRVLQPSEFNAAGEVIPAAGDWSRAVGVAVSAPPTARVAGYRLLAFYP